jgi:hypothetical protein
VNPILQINPEYEKIIPPLSQKELDELESNILSDGIIISPLIVWKGVIVDGHNRYKIALKHPSISYSVYEKDFANEFEAIAWLCKNQLGRRNLSKIRQKDLIGLRYEAEKQAYTRDKSGRFAPSGQNVHSDDSTKTAEKLANELGVNEKTIRRYGKFSQGLKIADNISPGVREEILSNKLSVDSKEIEALPNMCESQQKSVVANFKQKVTEKHIDPPIETFEEGIISSISGAVDMFKNTCENYFSRYKRLLVEPEYREKIILIFEELKKYINHIEGEKT